mgnify:CR=1
FDNKTFKPKQLTIGYKFGYELEQTKSLIYKNEFILSFKYKLKVYNRGFYLNGLE